MGELQVDQECGRHLRYRLLRVPGSERYLLEWQVSKDRGDGRWVTPIRGFAGSEDTEEIRSWIEERGGMKYSEDYEVWDGGRLVLSGALDRGVS